MPKFADLFGTLTNAFRIGINGVRLRNLSGTLSIRNTNDTADAGLTAAIVNVSGEQIVINSDAAGTGNDRLLTLQRNASQGANLTLTFPANAGSPGQVLQTDGTGNLSFVAAGSTSQCVTTDTTSLAFGSTSPVAMFTLPANAVVQAVRICVDTAFNGTPSLSVGIAGTTSKYVASNQFDLATVGQYEIYPSLAANTVSENLIATYSAGGASAGAARIEVDYAIPA